VRENPGAKRAGGSALLVTVMLLLMIGLVGLAALNTTMRDQQVAGFQNRKRVEAHEADHEQEHHRDEERRAPLSGPCAMPRHIALDPTLRSITVLV